MSSCPPAPIPVPPTTLPTCATPLGGSNTSILDACCNSHINSILPYSDCYQHCALTSTLADAPTLAEIISCLSNPSNLGPYSEDPETQKWKCFNTGDVDVRKAVEEGYGSAAGGKIRMGNMGVFVLVMGAAWAVMRAC
jgi:hypothetical protein